jgi:VIT1/CCC1 family predicted Fe2+/Mn2+ transporter
MPRTLTHPHRERHASNRVGWLRASVLGANDGIVSTASIVLGVAAANTTTGVLLTTGVAALAAGAFSMAVGEYVSVSSQRDAEQADIAKERHELERYPEHELDELTGIYMAKGLDEALAREVAVELSKGDRLAVHMAEELGLVEGNLARPVQASAASAASFAVGALIPLLAILITPTSVRIPVTALIALCALGALGAFGARIGGAPIRRATARTLVGGAGAMALTTLIGHLVGGSVA